MAISKITGAGLSSITAAELGTDSVDTDEIKAGAVTTVKIENSTGAADGVTTAKIATDAVTFAKIEDAAGIASSYHKVPSHTTANVPGSGSNASVTPVVGMIIYNTTFGVLQQYNAQGWQSIDSPPAIASFTYPDSATALDPVGEIILTSSSTTNTDATITVSSTTNLTPGMTVSGTGIPSSTTIIEVTSGTVLELSANATATGNANVTLYFNSQTSVIAGSNFQTGLTVTIDGTAPRTVTRNSVTQVTIVGTPAKAAATYTDGLVVTNPTGLSGTIDIAYDALPAWTTAAGSLGTFVDGGGSGVGGAFTNSGTTIRVVAAEGADTIDYAQTNSAGVVNTDGVAGLVLGTTGANAGYLTGTLNGTDGATNNFYVKAQDDENQFSAVRLFNIISRDYAASGVEPDNSTAIARTTYDIGATTYYILAFKTVGDATLTVSAAIDMDILVVGGGAGGASQHSGGGGGGGVLYNSATTNLIGNSSIAVPVGTYQITVGDGGAGAVAASNAPGIVGVSSSVSKTSAAGTFATMNAGGGGAGGAFGPGNNGSAGLVNNGNGGGGGSDTGAGGGGPGSGTLGGNGAPHATSNGGGGGGGGSGQKGWNAGAYSANISGNSGGTASGTGSGAGNGGRGDSWIILDNVTANLTTGSGYYGGGGGGGAVTGPNTAGNGGLGGGGGGGGTQSATNGLGGKSQYLDGAPGNSAGGAGAENTGGGGGASGSHTTAGGAGGSGIVIVRYALA